MKGIFKTFLVLIIFILSIGAIPNSNIKEFNILEEKLKENNEFIENGVRVHYEVPVDINEYENIKNIFLNEFGNNMQEKEDSISYSNEDISVSASFFYNENICFVQIDYINKSNKYDTLEIENKLAKIINNKSEKTKYFSYIKLKIVQENKNYNDELLNHNLKDKEIINIKNGKVGKAFLKDDTRVNIGYVRYNTGDYLIIGTPVIFITY